MALTRDLDETVKARARRDREFREGLLHEAAEALLQGETDRGHALADLAGATDDELAEHLEDAEDMAVLRERLANVSPSDFIPHAQIEAELRAELGE